MNLTQAEMKVIVAALQQTAMRCHDEHLAARFSNRELADQLLAMHQACVHLERKIQKQSPPGMLGGASITH